MVMFLNGLPVATVELKNPLTGQNVEHAISQYQRSDPKHRLFHFKKRALVHFAVDPDLAYMTTRLAGKETVFLPFNRGAGGGKGNPDHPSGYKTAYLWEEVWQRDSFLDILARFIHLVIEEKKVEGKTRTTESMIFPRYHQLDVVRRLWRRRGRLGRGRTSSSSTRPAAARATPSPGWPTGSPASTPRTTRSASTRSWWSPTGRCWTSSSRTPSTSSSTSRGWWPASMRDSTQLAEALKKGTPIIITTLQKFPFVTEKIGAAPRPQSTPSSWTRPTAPRRARPPGR